MVLRIEILLTILSALTVSAIFKDGTEYVYSYNGEMKIGTKTPAEYHSYSRIKADLHVKPIKSDLYMFFKNVKYVSYSGSAENDIEGATKDVPLPNDSGIFTQPFIYNRYVNGSNTGIFASKDDELWSIKIKRAIASMLYLVKDEWDRNQTTKCNLMDFMVCYAKPNGDHLQVLGSSRVPNQFYNANSSIVESYTTIRRTYDLKMETEGYTLEKVSSKSSYNNHQNVNVFNAKVKQTLELVEKKNSDITDVDTTNLIYYEDTPDFVLSLYKNEKRSNNLPDEKNDDILKLKALLESNLEYLKYQGLPIKWSIQQLNELDDLIYELKDLSVDQLNDFHSLVSKDSELSDLLLETALLTNSPKAYCFIVKLIERGKLNEKLPINLLTKMSSNPIPLTECLENGLLKLSNDKQSTSDKLRHQAVITLASMIRASEEYDKYEYIIKGFVENLNKSKNDAEKAIYIHALHNTASLTSLETMKKMAQGFYEYEQSAGHLRALAANTLIYKRSTDYIFQSLIDNDKQDIEVRASALNVLLNSLDEMQSTDLIEVLTYNENDTDLYQLLYAKIEAISKKTSGNKSVTIKAKNILNQLQKPKKAPKFATSRIFEYADETSGKGLTLEFTTYGNMEKYKFITCQFKLTVKDLYLNEYSYELYVRVTNGNRHFTHDDIMRVLFNRHSEQEIFLKKDGYVVAIEPIDLKQILSNIFNNKYKSNRISANQVKNIVKNIPTEMGTSIIFSDRLICLEKVDMEFYLFSNPEEIRVAFDGRHKCLNYYDLSAYNPIANLWNGAKSVASVFANFPIDLNSKSKVGISPSLGGTVTLNISKIPLGFQMSSCNFVYMEGEEDDEAGKASCAECDVNNFVTKGENYRDNTVFFDEYSENLGLQFVLAAYDYEGRLTSTVLTKKKMFTPPAMGGIILAIGNEHQRVTQLELIYHADVDENSLMDEHGLFLSYDNITLNYSVKNEDKVLKSWDASYKCNVHIHNSSECEINVISKKEGIVDRDVHCDISKIYNHDDVHRTWKIISNDIVDGKQSDTTIVSIENIETNNEEINSMINQEEILKKCEADKDKNFDNCLIDISMFRLSLYNISYSNLKPEQLTFLTKISDLFKSKYTDNFKRIYKYNNENNKVNVRVTRPVNRDGVNILVIAPHEAYEYKDVTSNSIISKFFPQPYSELRTDHEEWNHYCEVGIDYVAEEENGDKKELKYGNDWINMASRCEDDVGKCPWSVDVKKIDENSNDLVLRFRIDEDVVEFNSKKDFGIKLNDGLLDIVPNKLVNIGERLDVMRLSQDENTTRVILHVIPINVNIEFMKNRIRMSLPFFRAGKCRFSN